MAHKALGSRKLIGNRSFQTFGSISGTPINPVHFGQVFLGIPKLTGKPITFWNSWGLERFSSQILGWEPTCRTFLVGLIGFKYQRIQHIVNTCKYMLNPCQLRFGSCSYIYIHIFICIHMCIYIYLCVCVCVPFSSWTVLPSLPPNWSLASPTFEPMFCMSAKYMITSGAGLRFDVT